MQSCLKRHVTWPRVRSTLKVALWFVGVRLLSFALRIEACDVGDVGDGSGKLPDSKCRICLC